MLYPLDISKISPFLIYSDKLKTAKFIAAVSSATKYSPIESPRAVLVTRTIIGKWGCETTNELNEHFSKTMHFIVFSPR